jgi:hypothetical protein
LYSVHTALAKMMAPLHRSFRGVANDQEAEAFAGRFDRKQPPGLTPLGV